MYSLYFSFIFIIFTTVFVFAQCDGNFTEVSEANCTTEDRLRINDFRRMIVCQPRKTFVVLDPKPGQMFDPPVVYVTRCIGHPPGDLICEPRNATSIRIKQIPVSLMRWSNNRWDTQCRVVNVEEHTHCKQACLIKETDCKAGQSYNQSRCQCECENKVQKTECNELDRKVWNEEKCQCICKKEEGCTTGFTWNDKFCNCTVEAHGSTKM